MKAEAFWDAIVEGNFRNPLDIEPSSRPPGTILVTAPIGPLKDFRNFYFRSAFFPVAIMALAVFLAGVEVTGLAWESAFLALLGGSMPMFWQFEIGQIHNTGYSWGLVDTFQASLGALAMAGLLVAAVGRTQLWLGPALITLALVPLVKPSGFVLGGLISLAWLVLAIRFGGLDHRGARHRWIGIVRTSLAIFGVLGSLALASLHSDYFSTANMEFGKVALAQLRSEWYSSDTLRNFFRVFTGAIGVPLLVAICLLAGTASLRQESEVGGFEWAQKARWSAGIGMVIFLIGLGLTYQATLFRQTRYFFPVLAISTILFTPIFVSWSKRAGARICGILTVIPAALVLFLASPRLNNIAYSIGGYGLFSGFGREEVETTRRMIDQFRQSNAALPVLFTTTDGVSSAAFEAAFLQRLRELGASDGEALGSITRTFDWEDGGVVKIDSIYNADLLVIDGISRGVSRGKALQANLQSFASSSALSFSEELGAWKAWLAATPEFGSTLVALETPRMFALVIKDRRALERGMRSFIASRPWRPEFLAANRRSEFNVVEINNLRRGGSQIAEPVVFGNVLRVHALAITREPYMSKMHVSLYSERLKGGSDRTLSIFIHQIDGNGQIIATQDIRLGNSRLPERPVSLDSGSFALLPATQQVGVGIYEPSTNTGLLTDWTLAQLTRDEATGDLDPQAAYWRGRRASFDVESLPQSSNLEIGLDH